MNNEGGQRKARSLSHELTSDGLPSVSPPPGVRAQAPKFSAPSPLGKANRCLPSPASGYLPSKSPLLDHHQSDGLDKEDGLLIRRETDNIAKDGSQTGEEA